MKYVTLLIIIIAVFIIFRFISNIMNVYNRRKVSEENIVDLEKDPESGEYKPKE